MAYDDRDYSRGDGSGGFRGFGGGARRLLEILNASFPIGTYLGIRVRVHVSFLIVLAIYILQQGDPLWTIRWMALLFLSVLLHEFGHCLGCRSVGGTADDILMWPLGGLAFCAPPRRPWPEFVTVACGPLVNVVLAAASYVVLLIMFGAATPVSLDPFTMWRGDPGGGLAGLVADLFVVNYILLLFNLLLVFYPFDGGRLIQIALWTRLGFGRSMLIACTLGMIGAVVVALVGLAKSELLLVAIAVFGFVTCYQQKRQLQALGAEVGMLAEEEAWSQADAGPDPLTRWKESRAARRQEREAAAQRALDAELDRVLDKVHDSGLASLTGREKKLLRQATERSRS